MGFQGLRPWLISWVPAGRSIAEPSNCRRQKAEAFKCGVRIAGKRPQKRRKRRRLGTLQMRNAGAGTQIRTAETHKLGRREGSAWNPRRKRETREKRLGVWLVTARQEPSTLRSRATAEDGRPTGRAAVTGWLGSWAFFAASGIFLAADGTRMERGRMGRPTGRRDADRCGRDARAPPFSSGCGVLWTVTNGHKEGGEGGRMGRGRKKRIRSGRRGTPVLRKVTPTDGRAPINSLIATGYEMS